MGDVFGVEAEDEVVVLEEGDGGAGGGSWGERGALGEGRGGGREPWTSGMVRNMTNIVKDI